MEVMEAGSMIEPAELHRTVAAFVREALEAEKRNRL